MGGKHENEVDHQSYKNGLALAHWYSRAALGAEKLSDSDVEALVSAKPIKGWLAGTTLPLPRA
jgi:NAD-dependent DNA ligase